MNFAVLALGNWGTALANHLAKKGHKVLGWSHQEDIVEGIRKSRRNPIYLTDVTLEPTLEVTSSLNEALTRDCIVMAFPSSALSDVVPRLKVKPETILVSAIKGLEFGTLMTPLQHAERHLPAKANLAVLSGPSFARDLIMERPLGVVAASRKEEVARKVATSFASDWFRVYVSTDPLGVEIGGIVKNIIALAAGVSDGLGYGDSARAGLITRGLAEMMRLAKAMGADIRTLSGLSGLGDLAMTASSDLSRNRTVGLRLGRGEKLDEIISSLGSVAEAVKSTPAVLELANRYNVEMPITVQVARLLLGDATPAETARALMTRPLKREFEE